MRILIGAAHCTSPVGTGLEESFLSMRDGGSALAPVTNALGTGTEQWLGRIAGPENAAPGKVLRIVRSCAAASLGEAMIDIADPRYAVVLSTTKGDMGPLEEGRTADSRLSALGDAIVHDLGITTRPWIVSNACASGTSALILAAGLLRAGEADHALIIGVDVLSQFVLSGFASLHAISSGPCRPYDRERDGISLGEAAVSLVMSRDPAAFQIPLGEYLGGAIANDANHISGPSRTGEGLVRAVSGALREAAIAPNAVDAINAHGTGTVYNDAMEANAFNRCGLQDIPLASYKGYFGHTLGAAGLLESVIALHALREGMHLRCEGTREMDLPLPLHVMMEHQHAEGGLLLKTSSGFGGANAAVILRAWTS